MIALVFSLPLDFFQTRFDSPKVETAVSARAVLFRCPPIPLLCFFVLLPVSSIKIVTFSLWHSGQIIYVPSLSFLRIQVGHVYFFS